MWNANRHCVCASSSLHRPDAVVKAYKVKKKAEDRPMSMWISSIKQLEPVQHLLSPLLLDFMEAAWPSSISMVIPRGPWMDVFGLGDAAKHIGTPQSIAIRNPDCAVATHLMSLVGPIAVTSANPTGEADTTHHNQVFAKLGNKVDGVLCDGPSPENIASTVVDCTKIDSGQIGFFRVGLIPKSKVLQIFEDVQKRHIKGQTNPAFDYDVLQTEKEYSSVMGDSTSESGLGSEYSDPYVSPMCSPAPSRKEA
ncbi:putative threonylcarbamoyl-AMP synthase isoform X2 [Boleophthalmus pectinirostris]|uniref:putative threonylcarbamoyl-AMP synthase isoform X2 n=1 Tax=Boleophthalmus pectinirostris TaxID=150288 RepID=UPI002432438A|nr:putative threonylcarbamoyl-AMP synthase isoform X2 [Boleophthalmus pectinirostris]